MLQRLTAVVWSSRRLPQMLLEARISATKWGLLLLSQVMHGNIRSQVTGASGSFEVAPGFSGDSGCPSISRSSWSCNKTSMTPQKPHKTLHSAIAYSLIIINWVTQGAFSSGVRRSRAEEDFPSDTPAVVSVEPLLPELPTEVELSMRAGFRVRPAFSS